MRRFIYILLSVLPLMLTGCSVVGEKSTSMSIIYLITAVLSLLLLVGYFIMIHKKNVWFVFLFSSVFVVNMGYWLLSVSKTLHIALFANRLSYLGSVFLPMAIMMIILNVTKAKYPKYIPYVLSVANILMFCIAASYPYLDIYYKHVDPKTVNGVTVLCKTYGFLHPLYLVFLLSYFIAIIAITVYASKKKKLNTRSQAIVLSIATFVNICVWMLEQLVDIDFEFLSVSYIISELFLIGLYLAIEESSTLQSPKMVIEEAISKETLPEDALSEDALPEDARLVHFAESLPRLTPTETKIYNYYLDGKTTKEIMELLTIKENTLKYHNKNIYSKLGVSSRKELLHFAKML